MELDKLPDIAFCPECGWEKFKEIKTRDIIDNSPPEKPEKIFLYCSGVYFILISIFFFCFAWYSKSSWFLLFSFGLLFVIPGIKRVNPKSVIHRRKTPHAIGHGIEIPRLPWKIRTVTLVVLTLHIISPYFWNAPIGLGYIGITVFLILLT